MNSDEVARSGGQPDVASGVAASMPGVRLDSLNAEHIRQAERARIRGEMKGLTPTCLNGCCVNIAAFERIVDGKAK